jgi:secretion/DNA translocation related TadE-like protein
LRPSNRVGDERGAASVLAAVLVAALVSVTLGGVWVGAAVLARHRAQAAADLAALAAAAGLPAGAEAACDKADGVVRAMRATLRGCSVADLDVTVIVTVETGLRMGGQARAAARAGPTG